MNLRRASVWRLLRDEEKPRCSAVEHPESGEERKSGGGGMLEMAKRKRAQTPLERFHLRYLSVTDLSAQVWCEQQMVLRREQPDLLPPKRALILNMGKSIHLARELEDHDLVKVCTTTREDSWAIKLLNLLINIHSLQGGHFMVQKVEEAILDLILTNNDDLVNGEETGFRVREFPVFGVLEGIFVVGIIDQLSYTTKGELELHELKTRNDPTMPSAAQKKRDFFQVFLYKYLFDGMLQGHLSPDSFVHHLHLRPEQPLGPEVQEHARKAGFTLSRFQDLLELMFLNLSLLDIPVIDSLQIEYIHQKTNALLGTEVLVYEEGPVRSQVQYFLAYWKGERDLVGVDIEEAWKCRYCDFSSICDWRQRRAENPLLKSGWKKFK